MNVPAGELGEGFPGAAPEPAIQEAGFINTRLAVVGAIASAAAVLAPVSVMAADSAFAAERPAGTELFIGDETHTASAPDLVATTSRRGAYIIQTNRYHCSSDGTSGGAKFGMQVMNASGRQSEMGGYFVINSKEVSIKPIDFTPKSNDWHHTFTVKLKNNKRFPAGGVSGRIHFKGGYNPSRENTAVNGC